MSFIDTRDRSINSIIPDNLKPIDVIMSHKADGQFIPLYMQVVSEDETRHKIKIESVQQIKELHDRYVFYCTIINYGRKQSVILSYYVRGHKWYIEV